MRLDISMHNSFAVAEIESFEELKDVESNINIVKLGVEASEIGVVDVLEDERWCLALFAVRVSQDVSKD
jgi:hypothetical protein